MLNSLHKVKPREKAGSQTASRFEFQANFSILKILDLHETGADYRVLFDHFDDLTILNSSGAPSQIRFYQIKGRDSAKPWTIKQLVREEKSGSPPKSIIGKMYKNASDFSKEVEATVFASNCGFEFLLANETKTGPSHSIINGPDLHTKELQAIDAVLESDFPSPRNPSCPGILIFERTHLPLQQQATFVTGRLAEHLAQYAGEENFAVKALYTVLIQNVMARVGNTEEPDSLEKLHKMKSFSRSEIAALIERASAKRNFETTWPIVFAEMQTASYSSIRAIRIKNASLQYLRERSRGDLAPNEFSREIRDILESEKIAIASCEKIIDRVEVIRQKITATHRYSEDELFGALLIEIYESLNDTP